MILSWGTNDFIGLAQHDGPKEVTLDSVYIA